MAKNYDAHERFTLQHFLLVEGIWLASCGMAFFVLAAAICHYIAVLMAV